MKRWSRREIVLSNKISQLEGKVAELESQLRKSNENQEMYRKKAARYRTLYHNLLLKYQDKVEDE